MISATEAWLSRDSSSASAGCELCGPLCLVFAVTVDMCGSAHALRNVTQYGYHPGSRPVRDGMQVLCTDLNRATRGCGVA
jgi:hypothetical protein